MTTRTRFAPSPTGYLHVGGARTALYSWLVARQQGGAFILRIEDTDTERSTQASIDAILEGMKWLGLTYDEGPFYQTHRLEQYHAALEKLLAAGQAYRCTCTPERLETLRNEQLAKKEKPRYDGLCREKAWSAEQPLPFVIRFKTPTTGTVKFHDLVCGEVSFANEELDDLIIARSDGMPTYNFTVVVDDADMAITQVIRGADHLNNTPRQIHLFNALGYPLPQFAHVPMILGHDGKRLSKRHGAVSVMSYAEQGYLPQALLNYLIRLGWSHGDQEIFSQADMLAHFQLNAVHRHGAIFDEEKLKWLNQQYIKSSPSEALAPMLQNQWQARTGLAVPETLDVSAVIAAYRDRGQTMAEIAEKTTYLLDQPLTYDDAAVAAHCHSGTPALWQELSTAFTTVTSWDASTLKACFKELLITLNLKMPQLAQPLRIALIGNTQSPSIELTLELMGKALVLKRLQQAIEWFNAKNNEKNGTKA